MTRYSECLLKRLSISVLLLLAASFHTAAQQQMGAQAQTGPQCLDCHRASSDQAVHAIFNTAHGQLEGGGNTSCIACHGDSPKHRQAPSSMAPDLSYGPRWPAETAQRNEGCINCHEGDGQLFWVGSVHEAESLACDTCHDSHQQQTLALAGSSPDQQCLDCHTQVRAEIHLPSRHPIVEGKTSCTDCHNPHGSSSEASLNHVSLNDNCLSCHQDKRGPFLWEHPPVAEDCGLCHRPHGSVQPRLLTARGPALCQQCHAAAFHPSLPYGAEGLAGGSANQNVLGKNCMNCHSQVHGSNHPSGARLTR